MVRKFLQGVLFMLLLLMLAAVAYGAWIYRQTGTVPFTLPGVTTTPAATPTPTNTPTPTPTPIMRPAVIVNTSLPAGALLTEDVLTETQLPTDNLPADAATSIQQVVGQLLREPLTIGEPVRLSKVVPQGHVIGEGSAIAQMLNPGEVAIAYPISRLDSVGYAPRAGDFVDVLVTFLFVDVDIDFQSRLSNHVLLLSQDFETGAYAFRPAGTLGRTTDEGFLAVPVYVVPAEDQRPRMVAQLTIRHARVLYFGISPTVPTPSSNGTPYPPDVVILGVSPQDAVVLNFFMAQHAATTLVLRSALEGAPAAEPTVVPVTLEYIQQHFGVPLPAKLPQHVNPSPPTPTPKP